MNKILKALAATAALAAVVPFHGEGDKNKGSIKALLWRADWDIDPDYQAQSDIKVLIGFNNPFEKKNEETHLFADELVVDYCCDSTLVRDCAHTEEHECCCGDEGDVCGENCICGGGVDCACGDNCCCDKTESEENCEG